MDQCNHKLKTHPDKIEKACNSMVNYIKTNSDLIKLRKTMSVMQDKIDQHLEKYTGSGAQTPTQDQVVAFEQTKSLYHQCRHTIDQQLDTKYKNLKNKFSEIYKIIKDGVDEETLRDSLAAYRDLYEGNVSYGSTLNRGAAYMTQKYNLPAGTFNRMND